jgi:hypothetical protein
MLATPDPTHGTSFYRAIGPWSRLAKDFPQVQVIPHGQTQWASLTEGDLLFIQRPFEEKALKSIQIARLNGIPTWVDFDDNVFFVPEDNPSFPLYSQETTKQIIRECIKLASVVTVTNDSIKETFLPLNVNTQVIRNGIDLKLLNFRPLQMPERNRTLIWRGNYSHQRDINSVEAELVGLSHSTAFDGWKVFFVGYAPWNVIDRMRPGTAQYVPLMDVMKFFHFLMRERPAAILSPLVDSPFNRGRSNISYLESSYVECLPELSRVSKARGGDLPGRGRIRDSNFESHRRRGFGRCGSSLGSRLP